MTDPVPAASAVLHDATARAIEIVRGRFGATVSAGEAFFPAQAEAIARACEPLAARFEGGGTLFVFGRGAQASDAQHVAVEFVHPVIVGKRGLPAVALTNDAGVHAGGPGDTDPYAGPLLALGRPGDIALALCGGNVPPETAALLAKCRRRGLLTVLLAARGDGHAGASPPLDVDHAFVVPNTDPMTVQEIHETLYHVLWELVHVFFEHGAPGIHQRADVAQAQRQLYPFLFGTSSAPADLHAQVAASARQKWRDVCDVRARTLAAHGETIALAAGALAARVRRGGRVLAFGNGGSATDAQDAVADCMAPPFGQWRTIPALALTNDTGILTAVANDVGFEHVFARQVESFGRPEDVAVGFSTSGASKNVLRALARARARGLLTIAFSGYDGGPLTRSDDVEYCITAPGDYVPRVQEAHATAWHALLAAAQAGFGHDSGPTGGAP
jgi:D-sedoheptulose 7-phosphate isomerase